MAYAYRCTQTQGCSESKDEANRGDEDVMKAVNYLFTDGKKRFPVIAYKNVTKYVANVKNDVYTCDKPS